MEGGEHMRMGMIGVKTALTLLVLSALVQSCSVLPDTITVTIYDTTGMGVTVSGDITHNNTTPRDHVVKPPVTFLVNANGMCTRKFTDISVDFLVMVQVQNNQWGYQCNISGYPMSDL
jgi:hypothetical protein